MRCSGSIVIGSTIIPDSERLTLSISPACISGGIFLWMIPRPPFCAMLMAVSCSVTVSMAADTNGQLSSISGVSWVLRSTSLGSTSEAPGTRRTSSKVSPSEILLAPRGGLDSLSLTPPSPSSPGSSAGAPLNAPFSSPPGTLLRGRVGRGSRSRHRLGADHNPSGRTGQAISTRGAPEARFPIRECGVASTISTSWISPARALGSSPLASGAKLMSR